MGRTSSNSKIISHKRLIDGKTFPTKMRQIGEDTVIEVESGTTGYIDSDTKTYLRIQNLSDTDMTLTTFGKRGSDGFTLTFRGEDELTNIIEGLKFMTEILEKRLEDLSSK